jgi:hypothetical protein
MNSQYYAVPVRKEGRTLIYNPFDGQCALAGSPFDLHIRLGLPGVGEMFAVWPLTRELGLTRAGEVCSLMVPLRMYVVVGDDLILPLASTVIQDAVMEVPDAGSDG